MIIVLYRQKEDPHLMLLRSPIHLFRINQVYNFALMKLCSVSGPHSAMRLLLKPDPFILILKSMSPLGLSSSCPPADSTFPPFSNQFLSYCLALTEIDLCFSSLPPPKHEVVSFDILVLLVFWAYCILWVLKKFPVFVIISYYFCDFRILHDLWASAFLFFVSI